MVHSVLDWIVSSVVGIDAEITGLVSVLRPWSTLQHIVCAIRFAVLYATGGGASIVGMYGADSVMVLAQAGTYVGTDDIGEYVSFTEGGASPYFLSRIAPSMGVDIADVDENGHCIVRNTFLHRHISNPSTTSGATTFEVIVLTKHYLPLWSITGPIQRTNVYYSDAFLSYFFETVLGADETRHYVCNDVLADVCVAGNYLPAQTDCTTNLAALEIASPLLGSVDGDTQGCRALHAAFAKTNPTQHCAHVSLDPVEDEKGRYKCQESDMLQVADLMDEGDLEYWREYAKRQGISGDEGYVVVT